MLLAMKVFPLRLSILSAISLFSTLALSLLPPGGNQSAAPYLLRGDRIDVCYDEPTFKARGECLQALLENYYGSYFTLLCPSFPMTLDRWKCRGCPWDRVNESAVTPALTENVNRHELFHMATDSCLIANHLVRYANPGKIGLQIFGLGIFGTLLMFMVTAHYSVSSTSEYATDARPRIYGFKLPEPVFLLALWVMYQGGTIALIASEDYLEFCEAESDKWFQEMVRISVYAALLIVSLSRCYSIRALDFGRDAQSWKLYLERDNGRKGEVWRKRIMGFLLLYLGPLMLGFLFFANVSTGFGLNALYDKSLCYAGSKSTMFFTIQMGKVLLEMVTVTIYGVGPSRNRYAFFVRYFALTVTLLGGGVLLGLTISGHDGWQVTFMTIPRVADSKIASATMNLAHLMCVSLLGLLEPVRIGWPHSSSQHEVNAIQEQF